MATSYDRADFESLIDGAAQKYSIPNDLLAFVLQAESNYDPNVVGDGGTSIGLGQINAALASDFNIPLEQLYDPSTNINAAARYLSMIQPYADGDWGLSRLGYMRGIGGLKSYKRGAPIDSIGPIALDSMEAARKAQTLSRTAAEHEGPSREQAQRLAPVNVYPPLPIDGVVPESLAAITGGVTVPNELPPITVYPERPPMVVDASEQMGGSESDPLGMVKALSLILNLGDTTVNPIIKDLLSGTPRETGLASGLANMPPVYVPAGPVTPLPEDRYASTPFGGDVWRGQRTPTPQPVPSYGQLLGI